MPFKDIEKKREYNRLRQQRIRAEKKGVVVPQPIILNLITDEEYEFIENEIDELFGVAVTDKTTPSFAIEDIVNEDDKIELNPLSNPDFIKEKQDIIDRVSIKKQQIMNETEDDPVLLKAQLRVLQYELKNEYQQLIDKYTGKPISKVYNKISTISDID